MSVEKSKKAEQKAFDVENGGLKDVDERMNDEKLSIRVSQDEMQGITSAFYKSLRIGDGEAALYWGERMRRASSEYLVVKRLLNCLGEDCAPYEWQRLYGTIDRMLWKAGRKTLEYHDLWQAIWAVAEATKWYEVEDGQAFEIGRHVVKEEELPSKEFPSWVWDGHTSKMWEMKKAGEPVDRRLDGNWWNRFPLAALYKDVTEKGRNLREKREIWIQYWRTSGDEEKRTDD